MDNVTHTLFALTLARTPLSRGVRGATAALVLASSAPDVDAVATVGDVAKYLQWHRGPTHGLFGIVGLGLLTATIVWAVLRARGPDARGREPSFARLAGISVLGSFFHVLMDLPTSYGTRILSPLDWHWFAMDWMPIVDLYLIVALAAGLYFGGRSDAARRWNVAIVLLLMVANYGVRAVAHDRAIALAPRLFGPTLPERCEGAAIQGAILEHWPPETAPTPPPPGQVRCLVTIAAIPTFLSPFEWRVIAQTSNGYDLQDVNVLAPRLRAPAREPEVLWRLASHYPSQWTPAVLAAAATHGGQVFLGFSRFPAARSFGPDATSFGDRRGPVTAQLTDVRFFIDVPRQFRFIAGRERGTPPYGLPAPSVFTVTVQFDPAGRIVDEHVGP
jgi:membrane-bound metal-dependent hydrolase YbcI (DUF457 family)